MSELTPCPFCGDRMIYGDASNFLGESRYTVEHSGEGEAAEGCAIQAIRSWSSREEARLAWNTRPALTHQIEAALERAVKAEERCEAYKGQVEAGAKEIERLRSESAVLEASLEIYIRRIQWEPAKGNTLEEIKSNARERDTYKRGDTLLMLVDEGDYHLHMLAPELAQAASKAAARSTMSYSAALIAIKCGALMRRLEWRPNKWVRLASPEGALSYLEICLSDGRAAPYTPSRCDQFGDDWVDARAVASALKTGAPSHD